MRYRAGSMRARERGFSLVEIMVAALIGLIGSIVIFQVFAVSEGQKRTTTGSADAQQGGILALYSIERQARLAGYAINYLTMLGCDVQAYDGATARDPIPSFKLAAVRITDGAGGAPDSITFVSGDSALSVSPVHLNSTSAVGSTIHKVNIRFGFNVGDVILAGQVGSGNACTMQQVSDLPASPAEDVVHDGLRYNKPGGFPSPSYSAWSQTTQTGGVVYDLGPAPSVTTFAISGSQLTQLDLLTSATADVIMEGIIDLQAQYGKDADGNGVVDAWNTTEPSDATEWSRVIAIRIALLSRSGQYEKTAVTGSAPQWTDGTGAATPFVMTNVDGTADSGAGSLGPNNWRNYRYRVFETTVPIRNQIWYPL